MSDSFEFEKLLRGAELGFSEETLRQVVEFRERVLDENARQNLTRLTAPLAFFEGHVLDSVAVGNCPWIKYPAMDLGSGVGVPGLLCGILGIGEWVLADSEGRKAEFLARVAGEFVANRVRVFSGRGEDFLRNNRVESVVARAVGPVGRIYGWLKPCSTWNSLVLLKGPSWEEEWSEFKQSAFGRELKWTETYSYEVGAEKRKRVIVKLDR